ncbi:MAG: HIT family protein [Patescibacteria group bacterium]
METNIGKCLICERIELIKQNKNQHFIKEFETGFAVLGDHQYFKGYCLLLCKQHKRELHELDRDFRLKFLEEMSILAKAVFDAFKPDKLNYELLGNTDQHMHWHIFPRYEDDLKPNQTVWAVEKEIRNALSNIPADSERELFIRKVRANL